MEIASAKRMAKLRAWSEMIQTRQESGMTVTAWCLRNGVSYKTYYYRLRKVRQAALEGIDDKQLKLLPESSHSLPMFTELKLSDTPVLATGITVEFGGARIIVNNGADLHLTRDVLRMVREIC